VSRLSETLAWLEALLEPGPMAAADVATLAKEKNIRPATLRRAAEQLPLERTKDGHGGWTWRLDLDARGERRVLADAAQAAQRAFALLGALRLEDDSHWGEKAVSWQREDARAILDPNPPHLHFLTRARGGSKTGDLGAVCVAALLELLPGGSRAYAFASDRDQAALLVDAIAGYVGRTEGLAGALKVDSYRVTATRGGARLDVMAADDASAWGLKGHLFICDEYAAWPTTPGPRRLWTAIASAVPKVADCRLVILTTAGDPAHPSRKLLEQAKSSEAWRVREVPGPVPWISPNALAEQRRLLLESQYARLHLNQWVASEDRLVDPEALADAVTLDGPQEPRAGAHYWIGVDIGVKQDRTAAAVCHAEKVDGDGARRVVLDRLLVWQGSRLRPVKLDDVETALLEASRRYNRAEVRLDPWQAVGLGQRLSSKGVRIDEYAFGAQSVGRLASTLHMLLRDRRVSLFDDTELLDELANVRLRETSPGVVRMDHDPDRHDDRAIALSLAALALVENPVSGQVGTIFTDMAPIPRRPVANGGGAYNPLTADPWARARTRQ
jgi:phage terminase large subunit-like protein